MSSPAVSVVLPVYNGENYLRLAIDSVLSQTLQDFELIVVDDGSTDATPDIARGYGDCIRYVRQENTGVAGAFNHGLRLAGGRYISWLSHDDVFAPSKLEKQLVAIEGIEAPAVCYTDVEVIDSAGDVVLEVRLPEYERGKALCDILTGGRITMASYSIFYDRRCVEEAGFYSERWRYTQDVEMLLRLARRFPLVRVPELLMRVREHGQRGVHSVRWEREVVTFYAQHLRTLPFEELFPELGAGASRSERAAAYLRIADTFAARPDLIRRVAFSHYRRALRENPAGAATALRRIAGLYGRNSPIARPAYDLLKRAMVSSKVRSKALALKGYSLSRRIHLTIRHLLRM